ncbi:Sau3AI family type II restriction endonuclease [Enterococcus sp. LJL90]
MKIYDDILYDKADPLSIEKYSKQLISKTFEDVLKEYSNSDDEFYRLREYYNNPRSKGGLGNLIEKFFFFYEPNSNPEPDFAEAGVELKVTPFEKMKNDKYRAGERLVIGMIPNETPINNNFEDSHVLDKLRLVLLILYLRDKSKERITYTIEYSKLFSILGETCKEDLEIIKSDYEIISNKVIEGRAHELSESDTMYLGACTKGATASKSLQSQYYNVSIPAKRRAFSLKQGYMTFILNKYILGDVDTYESISQEKNVTKQEFEQMVLRKILQNKGKSESVLRQEFNMVRDTSKDIFSHLAFAMLGIKSNNAEEFLKSDTLVKAIRIEKNGKIKESMSFPTIKFNEFLTEEWEESYVYNFFTQKRFLFVVYKNNGTEYVLQDAKFWNMPMSDLESIGKEEWLIVQKIVKDGVKLVPKGKTISNNFPNMSETKIFHLRPHSAKAAYLIGGVKYGSGSLKSDADTLPNGNMMTKQCFWLNKDYILEQL